jgi:hypothetical protein
MSVPITKTTVGSLLPERNRLLQLCSPSINLQHTS